MYDPARRYGGEHYDPDTAVVWKPSDGPGKDATRIGRTWYLPYRRHLTPGALRAELCTHGFRVLEQSPTGGDVVCTLA